MTILIAAELRDGPLENLSWGAGGGGGGEVQICHAMT